MGFLAAGTSICPSSPPIIPPGNGQRHSESRWSKALSLRFLLTLSFPVLRAAATGTGGLCGSVCEAAESAQHVRSQSGPLPCAGSTGPSLPLTLCNGQVHPFVYGGSPVGHSSVPESRIWPLLFAQAFYLTRASSLPGSKVTPLCPSSLLWPSVLLSSFRRWGKQGTVTCSDFLKAREGVSAGVGVRGHVSGSPSPSLSPLAVGLGQCVVPTHEASQGAPSVWIQKLWAGLQRELGEPEAEGSSGEERGAVQAASPAPSCQERVVSSAIRCS